MITVQEYAQLIEKQLNENAHSKAFNFTFKVWPDVGDYEAAFKNQKETTKINCVLLEQSGDYTPIKAVKSKFTTMLFEIAVNQYDVDNVKIILQEWTTDQLGSMYTYDDISYFITPSAPNTGTAVNTCDLGSTVPLTMTITIQQTTLGQIANEMTWTIATGTIEAAEVNPLRGQIISQRTQETANYVNEAETKSTNQLATFSIGLTIPVAKTPICKQLFDDVLTSAKDTIYTISMSDGWSAGISADFIMSSGELEFESGKVNALRCTFLKNDGRLS